MKKLTATVAVLVLPAFLYANRSLDASSLTGLDALERAPPALAPVKSAFVAVNENALGFLPTAATLRAEDAVANVVVSLQ